jgi:hypothetical protein
MLSLSHEPLLQKVEKNHDPGGASGERLIDLT